MRSPTRVQGTHSEGRTTAESHRALSSRERREAGPKHNLPKASRLAISPLNIRTANLLALMEQRINRPPITGQVKGQSAAEIFPALGIAPHSSCPDTMGGSPHFPGEKRSPL